MGRIEVMPDSLANQIAAGEVVERPASCVKELVENSLDAGATKVRVAIEDGGITSITVQDDGIGMDAEDAVVAFSRHATSKVHTARDLLKISTMGFRGEALASIAAVARVTLQTRPPASEGGIALSVEGSKQTAAPRPVGVPVGTTVVVDDLFFNTPARLKYLRTVQTEQARCVEVVQRAALARPDVAFTLETGGRTVFTTSGRGNVLDVAAVVFAAGEARQLLKVEAQTPDYRLRGFIGRPTQAKASRAYGHFFLNQRPIRNYALHQAVVAGYAARLMTRRHPIYVLSLELDPALVDVNIHPHKAEVRFSEERDVCRLVQRAVQAALDGAFLVPSVEPRAAVREAPSVQSRLPLVGSDTVRERPAFARPAGSFGGGPCSQGGSGSAARPSGSWRGNSDQLSAGVVREQVAAALAPVQTKDGQTGASQAYQQRASVTESNRQAADSETHFETEDYAQPTALQLRPIGQALGMYIVADDGESLYIIDQHAAHERVLYERFHAQVRTRIGNRIPLLTPLPFRLTPRQLAAVTEHTEVLCDLGFDLEPFGGADVIVRSVPEVWEGLDASGLAEQLFTSLAEDRFPDSAVDSLREHIVMQACKAAIKANHRLAVAEMEALCTAVCALEDPFHCPHGRPILIQLTSAVLEKEFRRSV